MSWTSQSWSSVAWLSSALTLGIALITALYRDSLHPYVAELMLMGMDFN